MKYLSFDFTENLFALANKIAALDKAHSSQAEITLSP